ncbi:MAG: trp operon repressor [Holosporales bacterium]|jgi:TrpR-related protein YerC/YecD|nr:trp operon repressor [Holosporales bacterium]
MSVEEEGLTDLFEAMTKLESREEIKKFMIDLCTPQELKALKERWNVCQLIDAGQLSYREIGQKLGVSTTTVTRVARFLRDEPYLGYSTLLSKLKGEK